VNKQYIEVAKYHYIEVCNSWGHVCLRPNSHTLHNLVRRWQIHKSFYKRNILSICQFSILCFIAQLIPISHI